MPTFKPRKHLTDQQQEILELLYKFRFATTDLIVSYQELGSRVYTYRRLKLLVERGYIGRRYDGTYRIRGNYAFYYLLPRGIRQLRADPEINVKALLAMYKDGSRSQGYMEHCLSVFRLYVKFNELYGEALSFFTKSELTGDEQFPKKIPDGYLVLENKEKTITQCMLEMIETTIPFFVVRQKILKHIRHCEASGWQGSYPDLLLLCENASLERRVRRLAATLLVQTDTMNDLRLYTTVAEGLLRSPSSRDILLRVLEPKETLSLSNLLYA